MSAYYNDNEPYVCRWLENLIGAGLIPQGDVDCRSIGEVDPDDLRGYTQCHFFAGIGGWAYALRLAGWTDDRPVWTGSCPCQPFSIANTTHRGAEGHRDGRDLWPSFGQLIRERCPPIVFGEQVPASIGWGWWDRVALELEKEGYACAAMVLGADYVGAPHRRHRLYWMADSDGARLERRSQETIPGLHETSQSVNGDPFAKSRSALAGNYRDLLPCDGVSPSVEHSAAKAYGNAVVPQVAAEFIKASM